jgi:hypothetical protein
VCVLRMGGDDRLAAVHRDPAVAGRGCCLGPFDPVCPSESTLAQANERSPGGHCPIDVGTIAVRRRSPRRGQE